MLGPQNCYYGITVLHNRIFREAKRTAPLKCPSSSFIETLVAKEQNGSGWPLDLLEGRGGGGASIGYWCHVNMGTPVPIST